MGIDPEKLHQQAFMGNAMPLGEAMKGAQVGKPAAKAPAHPPAQAKAAPGAHHFPKVQQSHAGKARVAGGKQAKSSSSKRGKKAKRPGCNASLGRGGGIGASLAQLGETLEQGGESGSDPNAAYVIDGAKKGRLAALAGLTKGAGESWAQAATLLSVSEMIPKDIPTS